MWCTLDRDWVDYCRIEDFGANIQTTNANRPRTATNKTDKDNILDEVNEATFQSFAVWLYQSKAVEKGWEHVNMSMVLLPILVLHELHQRIANERKECVKLTLQLNIHIEQERVALKK